MTKMSNCIKCTGAINHNRYNINNGRKTALFIVQHFMTHGVNAMSVSGLQYNPNWTEGQRRFIEKQWIKKLNTNYPGGLNWGRLTQNIT